MKHAERPPALRFIYWLVRSVGRVIWFLIGVAFVLLVLYVLERLGVFNHSGPSCHFEDCIY